MHHRILFVGNCQALSLAIYVTELLQHDDDNYDVAWLCYSRAFVERGNAGAWTRRPPERKVRKCRMVIDSADVAAELSQPCDAIMFQPIRAETSAMCCFESLSTLPTARHRIVLPNVGSSLQRMRDDERAYGTPVPLADLIESDPARYLLNPCHPTTELFVYVLERLLPLCDLSADALITAERRAAYASTRNYTELPGPTTVSSSV
jgi:hypothetical protein